MGDRCNYYDLLQISPTAEPATVQRVYRMLAARFHPDNPETADIERFLKLQEAYRVLSDPERRASYDASLNGRCYTALPLFEMKEFVVGIDVEANRRLGILCLLYNRRRSNPGAPGMSVLDLETVMAIPREYLEFTIWYLRDKGYVRQNDSSEIVITSDGVDFVESSLPTNRIAYALLHPGHTEASAGTPPGENLRQTLNS